MNEHKIQFDYDFLRVSFIVKGSPDYVIENQSDDAFVSIDIATLAYNKDVTDTVSSVIKTRDDERFIAVKRKRRSLEVQELKSGLRGILRVEIQNKGVIETIEYGNMLSIEHELIGISFPPPLPSFDSHITNREYEQMAWPKPGFERLPLVEEEWRFRGAGSIKFTSVSANKA